MPRQEKDLSLNLNKIIGYIGMVEVLTLLFLVIITIPFSESFYVFPQKFQISSNLV